MSTLRLAKSMSIHRTERASVILAPVANRNKAKTSISGRSAWALKALIHSNVTGFLILVSTLKRFILSGGHRFSSAQWLMTASVGTITCRLRVEFFADPWTSIAACLIDPAFMSFTSASPQYLDNGTRNLDDFPALKYKATAFGHVSAFSFPSRPRFQNLFSISDAIRVAVSLSDAPVDPRSLFPASVPRYCQTVLPLRL